MIRKLAVLAAALLIAMPAMAKVEVLPGIAFLGSTTPAISFGALVDTDVGTFGAQLFVGFDSFILTFRQYPWSFSFEDYSIPVFLGLGGITLSDDGGQFLAGLYAEAGLRLLHFMSVNFSIAHFGYVRSVSLGVEVHFALELGGDAGG